MTGSLATGASISSGGVLQATVSGIEVVAATGSAGNDVILGGSGNDTVSVFGGADRVATGAGDDDVQLYLDGGADVINMGLGFDQIATFQTLAGDLDLVMGATSTVKIGGVLVSTWTGVDQITLSGGAGNDTITTAGGNDLIYAGNGANLVQTADGDDGITAYLDGLTDTVDGGLGNDMLSVQGGSTGYTVDLATPGVVLIKDGLGIEVQATGIEHLTLYGGYSVTASDLLLGLSGDDTLFGNAGNDTIDGGAGNDLINGGAGVDRLTGGAGADQFAFTYATDAVPGPFLDRITDFAQGSDVVVLSNIDANIANGFAVNEAFSFIATAAFGHVAGQLRYYADPGSLRVVVQGDTNGDGVADLQFGLTGAGLVLMAADFIL